MWFQKCFETQEAYFFARDLPKLSAMDMRLSVVLLSVLWVVKWAACRSHLKEASNSTHSPELIISGVVTVLPLYILTGHAT